MNCNSDQDAARLPDALCPRREHRRLALRRGPSEDLILEGPQAEAEGWHTAQFTYNREVRHTRQDAEITPFHHTLTHIIPTASQKYWQPTSPGRR